MIVESYTPKALNVTVNAANRVQKLLQEESSSDLMLRIYVTGGGCSGFQYGFKLDDVISDDDIVVKEDNAGFVLDSLSYQYLVGSTLDFEEGLAGARFVVSNPNATVTCGCGSSFSI
jgi:iron-sulfur cluster insertion protein